jgi:hypothetical protein
VKGIDDTALAALDRDRRIRGHAIPHQFEPASAAASLVAVIGAQIADAEHRWEFTFSDYRWAAADTDPDRPDRSVVVDITPGLSTDLNDPDMPKPWRPGPLVAGYARGQEALLQVGVCVDMHDVANVVLALVAFGVLPAADGMNR